MLRVALTALFIVLANASAAADNERIFPADTDGTITFTMPSGNVGCTYVPAGGTPVYDTATGDAELHCTRVEPRYLVVILMPDWGGPNPSSAAKCRACRFRRSCRMALSGGRAPLPASRR